jgi:hypothetical protein
MVAAAEPAVVHVCIASQTLTFLPADGASRVYRVSTAAHGSGCVAGSFRTPVGPHRVRLKIGGGCPAGSVFVGRRATGEIHTPELAARFPGRDWILSRILWLQGMAPGLNRGGDVDTLRRFIYIHGTADESDLGRPCSHGCVRMGNLDVIELFDRVPLNCPVHIHEHWTRMRQEMP